MIVLQNLGKMTFEFIHNSHLIRSIEQNNINQGLNPGHLLSSQAL